MVVHHGKSYQLNTPALVLPEVAGDLLSHMVINMDLSLSTIMNLVADTCFTTLVSQFQVGTIEVRLPDSLWIRTPSRSSSPAGPFYPRTRPRRGPPGSMKPEPKGSATRLSLG